MQSRKKGFTLAELVIVVAIILVLAGVITSRITGAVAKARDVKAISSVEALRKASNIYYAEKNKTFANFLEEDRNSKGQPILLEEIKNLMDGEFLSGKDIGFFDPLGNGKYAIIKVGSLASKNRCGSEFKGGYILPVLDKNGINISIYPGTLEEFEEEKVMELYDSKCILWSDK